MIKFTYSFCMALLHSFWQAALLVLLYITVDKIIHRNNAPLAKRNFLFAAIATQIVLSVLTFSIYFFDTAVDNTISSLTQNISGYVNNSTVKSITPWIFCLYISIIVLKLVQAIYSWFNFKYQYKSGLQKASVELKLFTEIKAHHFGIKRKVKLWLSNSIHTPVTFGFFKPVILLPVALLNNISTKQAETLILHELTHIRTNDYLLNWFLLVAETVFFFNPFVTNLCKKIRLEREKNCDINVLAFEYSPALYAETLLQAERLKRLVPNFQLAAVNEKKHLLKRIQFFTNEKIINKTLRFNIVAPLIGLVLLVLLSTAVLFQSAKINISSSSTADINYFPINNYIISDTESPNTIENTPLKLTTEHTQPELLTAVIVEEKNADKMPAATPKSAAVNKVEDVTEPKEVNYVQPIAIKENDATRQIIIKEEGAGSASVKVYYLTFEDGQWILQPEWVLSAKEILTDSLSLKVDSSKIMLRKVYPAQQ